MENIWQTAKRLLLVEEAKKRSDAAHAYSLEIGKRRNKPPPALPTAISDTTIQTKCLQTIMAEGNRHLFNHWREGNVNALDRVQFEPCRI